MVSYSTSGLTSLRIALAFSGLANLSLAAQEATVTGELRLWHPIVLTFDGPQASEDAASNPFRNYRMDVTFEQGAKKLVVPGFFAADGNAAETGAAAGNKWRAHFLPEAAGPWRYTVSFRQGADIAVADTPAGGQSVAPDGATGTLDILPSDKTGERDHRRKGMLKYVGQHHARYQGTGDYFINVGSQSPENFLAYFEFDNTRDLGGAGPGTPDGLHHYDPHVKDWKPGDPTWKGGKGKGIIGALNYLASEGMNTFYAITNSVGGDGKDTWPWVEPRKPDRYDVSKLAQWEIVFSHMDRLGLQAMLVTQEEEDEEYLGRMTPERKLYYRELIARFSHHHAVIWDLDEEMDYHAFYQDVRHIKDICEYFKKTDPYRHPIQYVQWKGELLEKDRMPSYERLLGYPNFDGTGLQHDYNNTFRYTKKWVDESARAGHKWLVGVIETNPNTTGVVPDDIDFWHDKERKHALWGNLMAGGSGIIFFFGYRYAHSDIGLEDFRSRDHLWDLMRHAHQFFTTYLPFHEMANDNNLVPGDKDFVYAKPGDIYALYLQEGGTPRLNLAGAPGTFTVKWFDPRNGGAPRTGSIPEVTGGSESSLGPPPMDPDKDWAVLVQRKGYAPTSARTADRPTLAPGRRLPASRARGIDAAGRSIPSGPRAAGRRLVPVLTPRDPGR